MVRYLSPLASDSSRRSAAARLPGSPVRATGEAPLPDTTARTATGLRVRDVMSPCTTGVTPETPFLNMARTLAPDVLRAVPVTDDAGRVIAVVSESDLLARAAELAAPRGPGLFGRLSRRRKQRRFTETAATLMTAPAVEVHAATPLIEAARAAARSRGRQLFVTDHKGRLVGVVSRRGLLCAPVRDDAGLLKDIRECLENGFCPGCPKRCTQRSEVENSTVTLTGRLDVALIPQLIETVSAMDRVVGVADRLRPARAGRRAGPVHRTACVRHGSPTCRTRRAAPRLPTHLWDNHGDRAGRMMQRCVGDRPQLPGERRTLHLTPVAMPRPFPRTSPDRQAAL
ncbi:CBS domain-containing protein [Streptomyces sp. CA-132043]|uniref:CBS domain-containing protein n=1 Tax=Streptomyces sp. CA-132043 TaxID=3240048 RepID=UPI003D8E62C2